jgi:hypothetical protein
MSQIEVVNIFEHFMSHASASLGPLEFDHLRVGIEFAGKPES